MERKQELLLIIRQLNKDFCDSAAILKRRYPRLDSDNLNNFRQDYKQHELIHDNLVKALDEYTQLERNTKLVEHLTK